MIRFDSDYVQSTHPRILERLQETSGTEYPGYGADEHSKRAIEYIRAACAAPEADVHFLMGGTQANLTLISALLRPHQGVISADTGHISTNETGAIEATGHKVLTVPNRAGKLTAEQVQMVVDNHRASRIREHVVQPGLVYISHPTESGTVYTRSELEAISAVCREKGLPLMMDGARLGYGLAAVGTDVTLADIARLCDVFYIGGTKVGALFGEAAVFPNPKLSEEFRYSIKQHGGLLAKGFLLGIQFECLFEDGLYFELSRHGVGEATHLRQGMRELGIPLQYDTGANQVFPRLPNGLVQELAKDFAFHQWEKPNDMETVIRLCTSWSTKRERVEALLLAIKRG